jgi:AsmA family protein
MARPTDTRRLVRRIAWIGTPVVLLGVLVALWNWDWFIPTIQTRASAALGRPVTLGHLHLRLGPTVEVAADDVVISNPPDWPAGDPPLAAVGRLTIRVDVLSYIMGRGLVLPLVALDKPVMYVAETKDGTPNFKLSTGSQGGAPSPKIGDIKITAGDVHVVLPKLKTDFRADVATQEEAGTPQIVVNARGTYAAQPIEARLVGGALLSLRDPQNPWPINLTLANGPTHVTLAGTLEDPIALKGAKIDLRISGPDMGLLEPLVGFPVPKTPAYQIAGKLDFAGYEQITFNDFHGRLGSSDIGGSIKVRPEAAGTGSDKTGQNTKPVVDLDLRSNKVDLADLNGFIGGEPGRTNAANTTPQQRAEVAKARASSKLLPDKPISVPRLTWADIHLRYKGEHIAGRSVPLDNLVVALDAVDGHIAVHPISFGVGKGQLSGNIDVAPASNKTVHAKVDLRMQNLDVSRMMAATHTFEGAGSVSGVGTIDATGDSLASLLANGNGSIKMAMAGGELSAVLVDLTGLQFGKALLSALGVPQKTPVQCFVGDLDLKRGVLDFSTMTLDTGEAIVNVGGQVNLIDEKIDLNLKTNSKKFSVGSLRARINVTGTFKDPSIRPGAEVAARAGAAAGLAALFLPLAILPTIQFGTSDAEDARCGTLLRQARMQAGGKALPAPVQSVNRDNAPSENR